MKLSLILQPSVRQALQDAGFEIIKKGDVPPWMERVHSMPAPLYRVKRMED